jgi:TrmH family RNA methyltransferase
MDRITAAANVRFRELESLASSARERRKAGLALLDGVHLVSACRDRGGEITQLVVSDSGLGNPEISALLATPGMPEPLLLSDRLLQKLSVVSTPSGLLAIIRRPCPTLTPVTVEACVLLDNIQDPGNVGAILRASAAAGVREVLLSAQCADAWSPKVLRAGMGAHFHLVIHEDVDLAGFVASYRGRVIGTDQRASRSLFEIDLTGNVGLAFGNEGAGLSPELSVAAAAMVSIPMPGATESLNVGATAAICLFERVRQISLTKARHP